MVIIVLGVSGSGKTTIGRALAERLGWPFADADDWHPDVNIEKMQRGQPLTDEDRVPWIQSVNGAIRNWIRDGCNAVVACSALRSSYRRMLRSGVLDVTSARFVYLKGTYEEIDWRLRLRTEHFMPESLLRMGCCRFQRHRVRCMHETGGAAWSDASLRESSKWRR